VNWYWFIESGIGSIRGMAADAVTLCRADSVIREDSVRRAPAGSSRNRQNLSALTVEVQWPADVPPAFCGDPSWAISLRAEVESLRKEVRQLREEVEFWKAESHKHFCDAQYGKAMHQQALERIAQRDQEIDRLKSEVRGLRQQLFGRKTLESLSEHWNACALLWRTAKLRHIVTGFSRSGNLFPNRSLPDHHSIQACRRLVRCGIL
jgi:HAMP domain-containing protein